MTPADPREPLLVADAGVDYRVAPADPIAAWLDLMETVEALAPPAGPPGQNLAARARSPTLLVDVRL